MLDRKAKKSQSKCDDTVNGCDSDTRGSKSMVYHLLAKINIPPKEKNLEETQLLHVYHVQKQKQDNQASTI